MGADELTPEDKTDAEILDLRAKLEKQQGARFDLLAFHDAFMKLPYPVPVIERLLLANET